MEISDAWRTNDPLVTKKTRNVVSGPWGTNGAVSPMPPLTMGLLSNLQHLLCDWSDVIPIAPLQTHGGALAICENLTLLYDCGPHQVCTEFNLSRYDFLITRVIALVCTEFEILGANQ